MPKEGRMPMLDGCASRVYLTKIEECAQIRFMSLVLYLKFDVRKGGAKIIAE